MPGFVAECDPDFDRAVRRINRAAYERNVSCHLFAGRIRRQHGCSIAYLQLSGDRIREWRFDYYLADVCNRHERSSRRDEAAFVKSLISDDARDGRSNSCVTQLRVQRAKM